MRTQKNSINRCGARLVRAAAIAIALLVLGSAVGAATGTTARVSVNSTGAQANHNSLNAAISADGRFVVFLSSASNLIAGDTNGESDIFVHDRESRQIIRVSISSSGTQANGESCCGSR